MQNKLDVLEAWKAEVKETQTDVCVSKNEKLKDRVTMCVEHGEHFKCDHKNSKLVETREQWIKGYCTDVLISTKQKVNLVT